MPRTAPALDKLSRMIVLRRLLFLAVPVLWAQPPAQQADLIKKQLEYTRAHYTKYEYRVPMRDGVRLFTVVYAPKDRSQTYPLLMLRTPYSVGPYGIDNYLAVV